MSNDKQTLNNVAVGGSVSQTIGRDEPAEAILQFFTYLPIRGASREVQRVRRQPT
jgi:hypothetical protein